MKRPTVDLIVFLAHVTVVLIIYCTDLSRDGSIRFVDQTVGQLLLAMEVTTMTFHLFYYIFYNKIAILRNGVSNPLKWLEYAVSATLGTFAVANAVGPPDYTAKTLEPATVALLAAAAVAQQCTGFQLENTLNAGGLVLGVGFISALGLQVTEFSVVGAVLDLDTNVTVALAFATYVIGYSVFGAIMLRTLVTTTDVDSTEKVYSIAGGLAKLGVLAGDYTVFIQDTDAAAGVLAATTVFILLLFVTWSFPGSTTGKLLEPLLS